MPVTSLFVNKNIKCEYAFPWLERKKLFGTKIIVFCGNCLFCISATSCFSGRSNARCQVTYRHQTNMTPRVASQVLSNDVLLIQKIKRKTFVLV